MRFFCFVAAVTLIAILGYAQKPAVEQYADSAQCAACHAEIDETYQRTGMGKSFAASVRNRVIEDFKTANTFYHPASDRHYTMIERDGRYFQRRHQAGADGRPANIVEKEIHYVVGSGNHARTYLHRNEQNKLVQLPVSWYAEKGGYWGMSPGYDFASHQDFRRKITTDCMFCHNAYPKTQNNALRADSEAVVAEDLAQGIDCQRCHGPGEEHARTGQASAIINPAKLAPERSLEVCMQCHLETTSLPLPNFLRRFDRGVFSFRPGEALADYMIHFDHAARARRDDKFEISNSAYRLLKSACFQQSNGRLTCTTCHNPHDIPRGEAATRHYVSVCEGCHKTSHAPATNCISCHMPKRRSEDVVHAVMTDHFIQRRKPNRDLIAPLQENPAAAVYRGEVALYYPKDLPAADLELYSAVAQVTQKSNLVAGIRQLRAAIDKHRPASGHFYFELAKAYVENNSPQLATPMFRQTLRRMPDFWPAVHRLGLLERSIPLLERAAALSSDAVVFNDLGMQYYRSGRLVDGIAALKKAVTIDPDLPHAFNNLGGLLWESGDLRGAETAFQEAVRLQPDLAAARTNLDTVRKIRQ